MLTFLISLMLLAPQAPPRSSIEGLVTRAGTTPPIAIPDAQLELARAGVEPLTVRTDDAGHFQFSDLNPGQYRLTIAASGYVAAEYGQRAYNLPGAPLTVEAGKAMEPLAFRLVPASTLTGRVRDFDGEALAGAAIQLSRLRYGTDGRKSLAPVLFTRTNDRGEYRFYSMTPEDYYVSVSYAPANLGGPLFPKNLNMVVPANGYPAKLYSNSTDIAHAETVRLKSGEETDGIDFSLAPVPTVNISGTVLDSRNGKGTPVILQMGQRGTDLRGPVFQTQSDVNGKYELHDVPAGSYLLTALLPSATNFAAYQMIDVSNQDLKDINLNLDSGMTMHGRITTEDGTPLPNLSRISIYLRPQAGSTNPGSNAARIAPDGTLDIAGIRSGSYELGTSSIPEDYYVKAAHIGASDVLDDTATISGDVRDPLEIILSSGTGRIQGVVQGTGGAAYRGAQVVLIQEDITRKKPAYYKAAVTDQNGAFSFRSIPPGNYKLFAWDYIEPNAFYNLDFMQQQETNGLLLDVQPHSEIEIQPAVISLVK